MSTDGDWKWCHHKNPDPVDVTTYGYSGIRKMCTECGGKLGSDETPPPCPACGEPIPEEGDGEEPVYWKITGDAHCSMECVIGRHRQWLEREKAELLNRWFPGP